MKNVKFELLRAIKEAGLTQGALVRKANLQSETRLSRIINGLAEPTKTEMNAISIALNAPIENLGFEAEDKHV